MPTPGLKPPTDRTLVWRDEATWRLRIPDLLARQVGCAKRKIRALLTDSADFCDLHVAMKSVLNAAYDSIRVFHACRPLDVASYYARGLELLDPMRATALARQHFLSAQFPELQPELVESAIAEVGFDLREGRVWFSLDDRDLIEECGHYLIYGSEFLCGVAASLTRRTGRDYQRSLRRIGTPTVFSCDLPVATLRSETLREIATEVLGNLVPPPGDSAREAPRVDCSFSMRTVVNPTLIAGHWHPEVIPDPLKGFAPYRWRNRVSDGAHGPRGDAV